MSGLRNPERIMRMDERTLWEVEREIKQRLGELPFSN
jgi:hypothetical protein